MFTIKLFGKFEIHDCQGHVLHISTKKTQWLLAYLLLHPGTHTRDHLAGLFWPDANEAKASNSLRQALHSLNASFEKLGAPKGSLLAISTQQIELKQREEVKLDTLAFSRTLRKCNDQSELDNEGCLKEAIAFYRGDLLEECGESWCLEQREYFKDHYLRALGQLIQIQMDRNEYQSATDLCHAVLAKTPWHEATQRQLIYIYYAQGNRNAAIQQYRECKRVLRKELNVDPLPETETLYRSIEERTRPVQFEQLGIMGRGILRQYPELGAPFVGRAEECQCLMQGWSNVLDGKGNAIFLEGEAGIGKSRLAQEFFGVLNKQKAFFVSGRCFDIERQLPYQCLIEALRPLPWTQWKRYLDDVEPLWLAQVAKLLPELHDVFDDLPPVAPLASMESEHNRLVEGLTQLFLGLAEHRPLLIFLDDLQWADESTLQFIQYFLRRIDAKTILFLGAYRVEEVHADHGLHKLMQPLQREHRTTRLRLHSMGEPDVEALVRAMFKTQSLRSLEEWIYAQSKGVPLVAVELLKSFVETGILRFGENQDWAFDLAKASIETIPSTIQSIIESRLRRLSKGSRQTIDLASVLGRDLHSSFMKRVLRREHDAILEEIEELMQTRLIIYEGSEYHFRHDLIREFVYRLMIPERRTGLHQAVADALLEANTDKVEAVAGELVHHYTEAGNLEQALTYSLRAGDAAQKVYSNASAIQYFTQAMELADRLKKQEELREALTQLCSVCVYSGKPTEGIEHGRKALELTKDVHARARLWEAMAEGYNYLIEHEKALECCEQAIAELGKKDKSLEMARVLNVGALVCSQLRQTKTARAWAKRSATICKGAKAYAVASKALTYLGLAHRSEDLELALEYEIDALKYAERADDLSAKAEAYYALGSTHLRLEQSSKAVEFLSKALAAYEKMQDQSGAIWVNHLLCQAYLMENNLPSALRFAQIMMDLSKDVANDKEVATAKILIGSIYFHQGKKSEGRKHMLDAIRTSNHVGMQYTSIISTLTLLNERDEAIYWLRQGRKHFSEERLSFMKNSSSLKKLRQHPEYSQIMENSK